MAAKSAVPLRGKVALITGAGLGIGRATAQALAGAGASVVVADIDAKSGNQTVSDLKGAGHDAIFLQVDVSSEEQTRKMIDDTMKAYGRLDILHNNAGIMPIRLSMEETPVELWHKVIDIDLTGVFLGCKYGIPALKESGGGFIINTASLAGIRGFMLGLPYTAAKGGVVMLTQGLAGLLQKDNIRVNAICPTIVDTELLEHSGGWPGQAAGSPAADMPKIKAEDIGRVALFLTTRADFSGGSVLVELAPEGNPKYSVVFSAQGFPFKYTHKALRGI
ncbi:SDR family NAD(P)-dependent oxidoreductase [Chloroflexota bacterium]